MSCNCCNYCCSGCLGRTWIIIFSILLIALGIFIWAASSIFTSNSIMLVLFKSDFRNIIRICFVALGICLLIFGLSGILAIIFKACKCECLASFILVVYSIANILLFIAVLIIFICAIVIMMGLLDFEKYFCKNPDISIVNVYDRIINSKNQFTTCPTFCPPSTTTSLKIKDCDFLLLLFTLDPSIYETNYFKYLDKFEGDYSCTGICSRHSAIQCTYFNDMSKKSPGTCIESIKNITKRNWILLLVIMIITLLIILMNIWSGFGLLCCSQDNRVDNEGKENSSSKKDEKENKKKHSRKKLEDEETTRKQKRNSSESD